MSRSLEQMVLRDGPSKLCFDKDEFMKKSFSVDSFLHEYRHSGSLEEIRDDLGIYLKVLRSEMIELINQDYADFVNLSANLIGLDQSINSIRSPLDELKQEIVVIKGELTSSMSAIEGFLNEKDELQRTQKSLKCLKKVEASANKMVELLKAPTSPVHMERMTQEIVQLRHALRYSEKYLSAEKLKNVKCLNEQFMTKLKTFFLESIYGSNKTEIETSLRIYSMLDECEEAEKVVRNEIVKPYMSVVISEQSLQNSVQGLPGIYNRIQEMIDSKLVILLSITNKSYEKRFNFMLNSFWSEVGSRLEINMTSIFAPGNPDFFYQKYIHTMEFLNKLESRMISGTEFRQHKQYKSFQTRWNLPVYFQIRFQELGGAIEGQFCREFTEKALVNRTNRIVLKPINDALENARKCWTEGIYLEPLFSRFLKFTLQIYSRISIWSTDLIDKKNWDSKNWEMDRLNMLMVLSLDLLRVKESIPEMIKTVTHLLPKKDQGNTIGDCFAESQASLDRNLEAIESELFNELFANSSSHVKQVTDIPRLYRKTNRDVPTKPCPYVEEMLQPATKFYSSYSVQIPEAKLKQLLVNLFSQLTVRFHSSVNEVLISVQKTEESLRRLKTLRDKTSNAQALGLGEKGSGVSDDDKIRVQLFVDVLHWTKQIENFNISRNEIEKLEHLLKLVDAFAKITTS